MTLTAGPLSILPDYAPWPFGVHASACSPIPIDALYLHVPFCSTKCHYCDFYSLADHLHQSAEYLQALQTEILLTTEKIIKPQPQTIFIGGGTPTLLTPHHLEQLLQLIHQSINPDRLEEFTIEANPNTFTAEKAKILRDHRVNRISFGAQSFNPAELVALQRDHDPASVPLAVETARNAGIHNINLDLIFGIPGQTLASWDHSLTQALNLHPDHLSCYSLIYEPNTPMTARLHRGEFQPIDEDTEISLFNHTYQRLRDAGFTRYETSNYARPNKSCRHNIHYWKAGNWLAWGPSGASQLATQPNPTAAHRWKNISNLTHYLSALNTPNATLPLTQMEHMDNATWAQQSALFWLRLADGLNYKEFQSRTHFNIRPYLESRLQKFTEQNLIELTPERARIPEHAVILSNQLLKALV